MIASSKKVRCVIIEIVVLVAALVWNVPACAP
jgi:hypothetical protein